MSKLVSTGQSSKAPLGDIDLGKTSPLKLSVYKESHHDIQSYALIPYQVLNIKLMENILPKLAVMH